MSNVQVDSVHTPDRKESSSNLQVGSVNTPDGNESSSNIQADFVHTPDGTELSNVQEDSVNTPDSTESLSNAQADILHRPDGNESKIIIDYLQLENSNSSVTSGNEETDEEIEEEDAEDEGIKNVKYLNLEDTQEDDVKGIEMDKKANELQEEEEETGEDYGGNDNDKTMVQSVYLKHDKRKVNKQILKR